jgi:hypothetical protein
MVVVRQEHLVIGEVVKDIPRLHLVVLVLVLPLPANIFLQHLVQLMAAVHLLIAILVQDQTVLIQSTMIALPTQDLATTHHYRVVTTLQAQAALDLILVAQQVLLVHIAFQTQHVLKELFLEVDATDHLLQVVPAHILEALLEHPVHILVAGLVLAAVLATPLPENVKVQLLQPIPVLAAPIVVPPLLVEELTLIAVPLGLHARLLSDILILIAMELKLFREADLLTP